MDFSLSEEQLMIRQTTREFAEKELAADARERDAEERFPKEQVKKMGELGFMGIMVDPKYSGGGMDTVSYCIMIEELSRVDASAGVIASVNNSLVCAGIEKFGTETQKQAFLAPLAAGKKLGSFCLSEPSTGSDASALQTTATRDGDDWIINGTKNWITNGTQADTYLVFATEDKSQGSHGVHCFMVERGTPGFSIGKKEKKLGIRSSDTCSLIFEQCRVPNANMLGEPNKGFRVAMFILDGGRIGIAAQALGIAVASLEAAVKYAKEREQFGRPIASFQAIQFMLAEMDMEVNAARLLIYRAAAQKDRGERFSNAAAMAKLHASKTAMFCADKAVQIHGGVGYTKDYPVERYLRDAKITEIYEGTSEIQKLVVARDLIKS
ncbi:MAG: acyl-CoA dehydrogenase [Deferribacteres bacterium]|nr:acyl-CoA dehydrogenase [candidate division KSB1 bacterium]MCB9508872.1 acyl-CoA dehydrogenase [Deferribacteres bacterium]